MSQMDRYLQLFLDESGKHLAKAEEFLVSDAPGAEERDALFREIHSLKGMAASMGYGPMAELAHRLEDLLDRWRTLGRAEPGELEAVLRACDRLAEMRDDIASGGDGSIDWSDLAIAEAGAKGDCASGVEETLQVRFFIEPSCPAPAARAYLILTRFKELGILVSSNPAEQELLEGRSGWELQMTLQGVARAEVEGLCETLTELKGVEFPAEEAPPSVSEPVDEAPEAGAEGAQPAGPSSGEPAVRLPDSLPVPVRVLDEFVALVGEMTISRSRLEEAVRPLGSEAASEELGRLSALVRSFQDRVMALRTLPFSLLAGTLKRAVRSSASAVGKEVDLKIVGEGIGLDKTILLDISDPLVHLVRNAVDHGLEAPDERVRRGKSKRGTLEVRARRSRHCVEVEVVDDGRGIDFEAVRQKAVASGLIGEEESRLATDRDLLACLFQPGFSTRREVTELSGRGVGLDVVKRKVEALGASVEVSSALGSGTEVRLVLPVSVAIVPVLTVVVGSSILALPVGTVVRTVDVSPRQIEGAQGTRVFRGPEGELPVVRLARLLRLRGGPSSGRVALVLVQGSRGVVALQVDRFLREEELFIKPLRGPVRRLRGVTGYSVLGDGRLVFLLDPGTLL